MSVTGGHWAQVEHENGRKELEVYMFHHAPATQQNAVAATREERQSLAAAR